jgi:hypothetical protein
LTTGVHDASLHGVGGRGNSVIAGLTARVGQASQAGAHRHRLMRSNLGLVWQMLFALAHAPR